MKKYTSEYISRDRIRIGVWDFNTQLANEKCMKEMTEAGVDLIVHGNATSNRATRETTLTLADKYAVEVYVNDVTLNYDKDKKWTQEMIDAFDPCEMIETYKHHSSFAGNYVIDEPGTEDYWWIAAYSNKYEEKTGKTAFTNLLPMYANAAQLKYGASAAAIEYYDSDPGVFTNYCEEYCKQFNTSYIATDIYPLNWTQYGKKETYKDYIESINQIATVARNYNKEFWCCIQTYGWIPSKRTPTESEYRWQCFCMLSFGCTGILLWNYLGSPQQPSIVHPTTTIPTGAYYDLQPAMWEMRNLSDLYIQYKNLGAFTFNCTDATPYLHMSGEYQDFSVISDIRCADPLLFGCFDKKQGKGKAFTVVNMSEFQDNKSTTVKFKAKGKKVTVYRNAEPTVLTSVQGVYTIELASGEGVFVTLD